MNWRLIVLESIVFVVADYSLLRNKMLALIVEENYDGLSNNFGSRRRRCVEWMDSILERENEQRTRAVNGKSLAHAFPFALQRQRRR